MRIGILTLPLHTNYGGILQAYALQTVLERMGHKVVVINKHRVELPDMFTLLKIFIKRATLRYVFHKTVSIREEVVRYRNYKVLSQNTQQFIDKYIHSFYHHGLSGIKQSDLNVDTIVVGSDQIWRPKYVGDTLDDTVPNAYLDFAKIWNIKCLSYAASFGTEEWEYSSDETAAVKELIKKFDAVSVREESGVKLCRVHLGVEATHVLDPTMMLSSSDYNRLVEQCNQIKEHKHILMNYVLDSKPEIDSLITKVAKDKGLQQFKLYISDWADGKSVQPPVEEWISSIRDADFVITDSFHCSVFCILFQKPFIVVGNKSRGYGRFKSLMDMFHLSRNLITEASGYNPSCDYSIPSETSEILKQRQELSKTFLSKALSK